MRLNENFANNILHSNPIKDMEEFYALVLIKIIVI